MSNRYKIFILIMAIAHIARAQQNVWVSGIVRDATSGEVLIGATAINTNSLRGTATDHNGFFSLKLSAASTLKVSYIGYKSQTFDIQNDTTLHIELNPTEHSIDEVVVSAHRPELARGNVVSLSTNEMQRIPALGGKIDVSRALQTMPGIAAPQEGSANLLVRGGEPGQNLYLFDNVPLIYVHHIGGFLSVFNPDIINGIDVYKGAFPARLGGRLSSVVDIAQREGDRSTLRGSLSIGITDISATVEGPTPLANTSFIVTGRKTMIDPLMMLVSSLISENYTTLAMGFHDINGKFTWRPNPRNTLNFSLYHGDDYTMAREHRSRRNKPDYSQFKSSTKWGNWMAALSWKQLLGERLHASHSLSYTRYRLQNLTSHRPKVDGVQGNKIENNQRSSVQDLSLRSTLKYTPTAWWHIETGLQASLLYYLSFYSSQLPKKQYVCVSENALFVDSRFDFLRYSSLTLGLRGVGYFNGNYSDLNIEPRLNLCIGFGPNQRLIAGYMQVNQNSHLLSVDANTLFASEVWIPASAKISPSSSVQYTAAWQGRFANGLYTAELALYHKEMTNLAMFRPGYRPLTNNANWMKFMETGGKGLSQGVELELKKTRGNFTSALSYTLARTTRQYAGVNGGREFAFDYDRTHSLAIVAAYRINNRLDLSAMWTFETGQPYTPVVATYGIPNDELHAEHDMMRIMVFGDYNSKRMRPSHRLDVGLRYRKIGQRGRRVEWNFSVYNLYCHQNPYAYYYSINDSEEGAAASREVINQPIKLHQITYFPFIPSVSYKVYFDGNRKAQNKERGSLWDRFKRWATFEE